MKGFIAFLLVAIIASGCAGKAKNQQDMTSPEPAPKTDIASDSVPEITLSAQALGNIVFINVRNNALRNLRVSPYCFALIIDNKRPEVRFHSALAEAEIPVTRLSKGMEVAGKIRFFNHENLAGQKLVFNSPDYKPIMTFIKEDVLE